MRFLTNKYCFVSTLSSSIVLQSLAIAAQAQHEDEHRFDMEEVIVTSSPLRKTTTETALPVFVLNGEKLREQVSANLGDTLAQIPGVNSASFGPGVGRPVVRGQTGNRVLVLSNGGGSIDAASISADHANSVEPLIARAIEVIKGPATLLYGNGASGGVVNIIDNRVPTQTTEDTEIAFEQRYATVNEGLSSVFYAEGKTGEDEGFAWHIDGSYNDSDNVDIPGHAIIEFDEAGGVEIAEEDNTEGFIANSDGDLKSGNIGASYLFSKGYIGASFGQRKSNYGIPPGVHGHGHGEEPVAEPGSMVEEEEEETVRIDMEQTRAEIKGEYQFDGFWQNLNAHINFSDYEHAELEFEGAVAEVGTRYTNEGFDSRVTLNHKSVNDWTGVIGVQANQSDFEAVGEEAFIPKSQSDSFALFAMESLEKERWLLELGLRLSQQEASANGNRCQRDENSSSGSAAIIWKLDDKINLSTGYTYSERSATIEELYSNVDLDTCAAKTDETEFVEHVATGLTEFGNPDLKQEVSQNIEIGLHKHKGRLHGEFSLYSNRINDYIYLLEQHEEPSDPMAEESEELAFYLQDDARFTGFELEFHIPVALNQTQHLDFGLKADRVVGKLTSGEYLPRIPAHSIGVEFGMISSSWSAKLSAMRVDKQDRLADEETPSAAYTQLNLYADYHFQKNNNALVLFLKGHNLLDEEIRNHASFVKNAAPEPGRGIELGLRWNLK